MCACTVYMGSQYRVCTSWLPEEKSNHFTSWCFYKLTNSQKNLNMRTLVKRGCLYCWAFIINCLCLAYHKQKCFQCSSCVESEMAISLGRHKTTSWANFWHLLMIFVCTCTMKGLWSVSLCVRYLCFHVLFLHAETDVDAGPLPCVCHQLFSTSVFWGNCFSAVDNWWFHESTFILELKRKVLIDIKQLFRMLLLCSMY